MVGTGGSAAARRTTSRPPVAATSRRSDDDDARPFPQAAAGATTAARRRPDPHAELRARRDELAERVAELTWDLGGLTYEMAIRDHFRLDVLVRRAAELQEADAELGEVERLLAAAAEGVGGGFADAAHRTAAAPPTAGSAPAADGAGHERGAHRAAG